MNEQPLEQLDCALRAEAERLLLAAEIWDFETFGWIDADTVDPNFRGHALWQTDNPIDPYSDFRFLRYKSLAKEPPDPEKWEILSVVAGNDFTGLMKMARMAFGLFLVQSEFSQKFFEEDDFRRLHWVSSIIYLATASTRLREFFIASAFRATIEEYGARGKYQSKKRAWFATPFIEANDKLAVTYKTLSEPLERLVNLSKELFSFQNKRDKIIHETASAIGQDMLQTFVSKSWKENPYTDQMSAEEFQQWTRKRDEDMSDRQREQTLTFKDWYFSLARASNEAFIIENHLRCEKVLEAIPRS